MKPFNEWSTWTLTWLVLFLSTLLYAIVLDAKVEMYRSLWERAWQELQRQEATR